MRRCGSTGRLLLDAERALHGIMHVIDNLALWPNDLQVWLQVHLLIFELYPACFCI